MMGCSFPVFWKASVYASSICIIRADMGCYSLVNDSSCLLMRAMYRPLFQDAQPSTALMDRSGRRFLFTPVSNRGNPLTDPSQALTVKVWTDEHAVRLACSDRLLQRKDTSCESANTLLVELDGSRGRCTSKRELDCEAVSRNSTCFEGVCKGTTLAEDFLTIIDTSRRNLNQNPSAQTVKVS